MWTVEKGAQMPRQRSLTPNAASRRDGKAPARNLPVTGARAPLNLSAQLLIHASHESPHLQRYSHSVNRGADSTGGEDKFVFEANPKV